jgi:hypothetical protein
LEAPEIGASKCAMHAVSRDDQQSQRPDPVADPALPKNCMLGCQTIPTRRNPHS